MAEILYKSADEGRVNPQIVEDILGITRQDLSEMDQKLSGRKSPLMLFNLLAVSIFFF